MTSRRRGITDGNQPCSMLTESSPEKFSPPSQVVPIHGSLSSMHAHELRRWWRRHCRGIDGTRMWQPWNPKACTPGALSKGQPEGLPSTSANSSGPSPSHRLPPPGGLGDVYYSQTETHKRILAALDGSADARQREKHERRRT